MRSKNGARKLRLAIWSISLVGSAILVWPQFGKLDSILWVFADTTLLVLWGVSLMSAFTLVEGEFNYFAASCAVCLSFLSPLLGLTLLNVETSLAVIESALICILNSAALFYERYRSQKELKKKSNE